MTQNAITLISAAMSAVLTVSGGISWTLWEQRGGKLVWYVPPTHALDIPIEGGGSQHIQTGVLILQNKSRKPLTNVTVVHEYAGPWFRVNPAIEVNMVDLQGGRHGLQFPKMPARWTETVTYCFLQQAPGNILGAIYCDEGDGRNVPFTLGRHVGTTKRTAYAALALIGAAFVLYELTRIILIVLSLNHLLPVH